MVTQSRWNDLSRVGIGVTRPHRSLLIGFSLCYSAWKVALSRMGGAFDRKARCVLDEEAMV